MNAEWYTFLSLILGSSFLTSLGNAYFSRRKNSVEIEDKINEMASRLLDEYREEIERLTSKIVVLEEKIEKYKCRSDTCEQENEKLRERIRILENRTRGL
jgi:peptidoglycan hydrolase CwlO-like protein